MSSGTFVCLEALEARLKTFLDSWLVACSVVAQRPRSGLCRCTVCQSGCRQTSSSEPPFETPKKSGRPVGSKAPTDSTPLKASQLKSIRRAFLEKMKDELATVNSQAVRSGRHVVSVLCDRIEKLCPGFWKPVDEAMRERRWSWKAPAADNIEFHKFIMETLDHGGNRQACLDNQDELSVLLATATDSIAKAFQEANEIIQHFKVVSYMKTQLQYQKKSNTPQHLRMWSDWEAMVCFGYILLNVSGFFLDLFMNLPGGFKVMVLCLF